MTTSSNEVWKSIPGFEETYVVSNKGRIASIDRVTDDGVRHNGVIKKTHYDSRGYEYVQLYKNGKPKNMSVHRVVALAFIPNPDGLPQVNHKDETRDNNAVENLEWCTVLYNQRYGNRPAKVSVAVSGEGNPRHILSAEDVANIRATYIPGDKEFGIRALSRKYCVKYVTIQKIVQGKLWKCLLEERSNKCTSQMN